MKKKYKISERMVGQFGTKSSIFVISKKGWFGFYYDTHEYYFKKESAEKRCLELNT